MSVTVRISAVVLTLALAVTTIGQQPKDRRREGTLKVGDLPPAISAEELSSGKTVKLDDMRGKPAVLIFGSCT